MYSWQLLKSVDVQLAQGTVIMVVVTDKLQACFYLLSDTLRKRARWIGKETAALTPACKTHPRNDLKYGPVDLQHRQM